MVFDFSANPHISINRYKFEIYERWGDRFSWDALLDIHWKWFYDPRSYRRRYDVFTILWFGGLSPEEAAWIALESSRFLKLDHRYHYSSLARRAERTPWEWGNERFWSTDSMRPISVIDIIGDFASYPAWHGRRRFR
jgi:hypothetical protein